MLRACLRLAGKNYTPALMPPMRQLGARSACHTSSDASDVLRSEKAALRRLVKSRLKQLSEEQMAYESTRLRLAPTQYILSTGLLCGCTSGRQCTYLCLGALTSHTASKLFFTDRGREPLSVVTQGLWDLVARRPLAGQKIAEHVLASAFFQRGERVGVYVHCAQLREVDTRPLLRCLLRKGEPGEPFWRFVTQLGCLAVWRAFQSAT